MKKSTNRIGQILYSYKPPMYGGGGVYNKYLYEQAPMSNIGMPVLGLFEHGGQAHPMYDKPMDNLGNPLMGLFRYGGMEHGGNCYEMGGPEYGNGGIHIKPSKRGTFTAAAKKHGKGVQEFASQVLANKENYSPAMVKKANFARNASKWHHEYGGAINERNPLHRYDDGGNVPETGDYQTDMRRRLAMANDPNDSSNYPIGSYSQAASANPANTLYNTGQGQQQAMVAMNGQNSQRMMPRYDWGQMLEQGIGAGMALGSMVNNMNNARDMHRFSQQQGLTGMQGYQNPNGTKGNYTPNTGYFRPQDNVMSSQGMYYPAQYGGYMEHGGMYWDGQKYRKYDYASQNGNQNYKMGGTYEMDDNEYNNLIRRGFKLQKI